MKKYKRFYLVSDANGSRYIKMESDLMFSPKEGKDSIKEKYPDAKIKLLSNKSVMILDLMSNVGNLKNSISKEAQAKTNTNDM